MSDLEIKDNKGNITYVEFYSGANHLKLQTSQRLSSLGVTLGFCTADITVTLPLEFMEWHTREESSCNSLLFTKAIQ